MRNYDGVCKTEEKGEEECVNEVKRKEKKSSVKMKKRIEGYERE